MKQLEIAGKYESSLLNAMLLKATGCTSTRDDYH